MSFTRAFSRNLASTTTRRTPAQFSTSTRLWAQNTVDSDTISQITHKESQITGQTEPVKGGPTAQAQKHVRESLNHPQVVSDIAKGEAKITGQDGPVQGGPAAFVASGAAAQTGPATGQQAATGQQQGGSGEHSGVLDSETISKITRAERDITGLAQPVQGGPTAQAQRHAGEPIGSQNLHDITEGEKVVTGGERVRGGPTATAQSELSKSRS